MPISPLLAATTASPTAPTITTTTTTSTSVLPFAVAASPQTEAVARGDTLRSATLLPERILSDEEREAKIHRAFLFEEEEGGTLEDEAVVMQAEGQHQQRRSPLASPTLFTRATISPAQKLHHSSLVLGSGSSGGGEDNFVTKLARRRRAATLQWQREHLPELAQANVSRLQAVVTELHEGHVVELAALPAVSGVCEATLRCVLLLVGMGFSELRGWNGITRALKKIGMSGLQRRLKAFSTATMDPLVISDCLDCLHPFFPFLSYSNSTERIDRPQNRANSQVVSSSHASLTLEFESRLVERLFEWSAFVIQESRARAMARALQEKFRVSVD
jgi:hypothetical protein